MLEILQKLISFKTIPQNKEENKKAINWIKEEINKLPVFIKEFNFDNYPSLFITAHKTKKPKLLLSAHLDVVPGPEELFKLKIEKKKILGRGVYDMKFAIACYLQLLKELNQDLKKYDLGIMITTDEEIGGFKGTKAILDKGYSCKICFLPDGGQNWNFEIKAKGVWHLKVKSYGKSAHGSRPWEGEGAIENLLRFLNNLAKIFPKEPCKNKIHWHNTLNIGKIIGGEATNQVSNYAEAFIDIRYIDLKQRNKILKRIKNLLKKFRKIKIENLVEGSPYEVERNNYYLKLFSKIAKEKFKIETGYAFSHGSSDARFFKEKNIPVILIRPKGGGHHSDKEWIDKEDLNKFYLVLKEFVVQIAK